MFLQLKQKCDKVINPNQRKKDPTKEFIQVVDLANQILFYKENVRVSNFQSQSTFEDINRGNRIPSPLLLFFVQDKVFHS